MRGRAGAIAIAFAVALGPGAVAAAPARLGHRAGAQRATHGLNAGELAGERVIAGFRGSRPGPAIERLIHRGLVAGVILFSDNFDSKSGARALVRKLQSIPRPAGLGAPLLVMIDQEGGEVKRLPGAPRYSAAGMGRRGAAVARRQGAATARNLRSVGVNVDLAPVLDVARPGSAIGAQHRAFGHTRGRVSRVANAFAAGLQRRGVAATGKHFPGLGAARSDTDFAVQRIDLSRRRLRHTDEFPYRRFEHLRGRMVMLSTAIYPAFDDRPAALSRTLATTELRGRLGFRGVSITDALDTVSARALGGPGRLARLGAHAGTDLLLYTGTGPAERAVQALRKGLHGGAFARRRFERSVQRVLQLRSRLR